MTGREAALPRPARVAQVVQETAQVRRLVLDAQVEAEPGQFLMLWLPGVDERPFSLVSAKPITLLVSRVGAFTQALHGIQEGDWLWWRGPLGHGFRLLGGAGCAEDGPSGWLLLVAGGYGVAPLFFLAQRARAASWPVEIAIGARTQAEILLSDELTALGCQVHTCTEDGSCGRSRSPRSGAPRGTRRRGGLVTQMVEQELAASSSRPPAEQVHCVYGCGPQAMLDALRTLCGRYAVPCQLSYEAVIKCAMGVCGSCARDGLLVCKDGPVLEWSPERPPNDRPLANL